MMIFKKHFIIQEAQQQLPLIKSIVLDILMRGQMMKHAIAAHQGEDLPITALRILEEIETLTAELEAMGCYYKDWNFEYGLVDFPAMVEGQEVLLCWRSDECDISWYHASNEGFVGRKPLPVEWLVRNH